MTLLPPRPVRYALAWVGAAAVAVAVGLLALQLLGGDIGPSVAAGVTTSSTPSVTASSAKTPANSPSGLYRTPGGTVYGTCAGPGSRPVVSAVANPGWEASTSRSDTEAKIEGGSTEYRIVVTCNASGVPVFTPTTDARGGSGTGGSGSPTATSTSSGADDHGGTASGGVTSGATSGGDDSGGHGGGSGAPSTATADPTRTSSGGGGSGGGGGGGHGGDDSTPHA